MIGEFYDAVDCLRDRNEVRFFLKSLLSAEEIAMLMRRIEIAILLSANVKYADISKMLGVGNGKIAFVQRALQQDDNGYKIIVKRLVENRKRRLMKIKNEEKRATASETPFGAIKNRSRNRILPDLLDAVIKKLDDDKELEKEALLFTPSRAPFKNIKDRSK